MSAEKRAGSVVLRHGPFSTAEKELLERHYGTKGPKWCAQKTKRTTRSIRNKASNLGLSVGDVKGMVKLKDLAEQTGIPYDRVDDAARHEGVVVTYGDTAAKGWSPSKVATVPDEWAASFVDAYNQKLEFENLDYLTLTEAAEIIGVNPSTVRAALSKIAEETGETIPGQGLLATPLQNVRVFIGFGRRIKLNPHDVEAARLWYKKRKDKARGLVPLKSIAVDAGLSPRQTRRLLSRHAEPTYAVRGGSVCAFYPADAVKKVLKDAA